MQIFLAIVGGLMTGVVMYLGLIRIIEHLMPKKKVTRK